MMDLMLGKNKLTYNRMNTKQKINKKMTFNEIMHISPDSVMILLEKGMHCIGCGMAGMETLEEGALAHGLDPDELVLELNKSNKPKGISKKKINKTNGKRKK